MSAKGSGWVVRRPNGSVIQTKPMRLKIDALWNARTHNKRLRLLLLCRDQSSDTKALIVARRAGYSIVRGEVVEVPDE